jgi:hypothetical protein
MSMLVLFIRYSGIGCLVFLVYLVYLVDLVDLVCLVYLVYLVGFVGLVLFGLERRYFIRPEIILAVFSACS